MASTSSMEVLPPSSRNTSAVGDGDVQQPTQVAINPLLLASASFGSSRALKFLLDREDAHEPPMTLPTQVFLDKLVGWTEGSSTRKRLTVPRASDDIEHGAYQPAFPAMTSVQAEYVADQPVMDEIEDVDQDSSQSAASQDLEVGAVAAGFHDIEDVVDQESFQSAASQDVEDVSDQSASVAAGSHEIEDVVDQESFQSAASQDVEDCANQPASVAAGSHEIEDVVDQESSQSAASQDLEVGAVAAGFHDIEDVVDQESFQSAASQDVEDVSDQPASVAAGSHEIEDVVDQESSQSAASQDLEVGVVAAGFHDIEDVVDQESFQSAAYQDVEDVSDQPALVAADSHEIEDVIDEESFQSEALTLPPASDLLKGVTAEGDTALHVVAGHGDNEDFVECVHIIFEKDEGLLFTVNKKGDTPLHCAARAGKATMVYGLIKLAERGTESRTLLRMENERKETALHDAVRAGNRHIVKHLLKADAELANYPKGGTSPLYLAILLEKDVIARTIHDKSNGNLSYSGPHGQNALHAAILRGIVMTEDVLKWNNSLTTEGDEDGSTPLHFASSLHHDRRLILFQPRENYTMIGYVWYSNIFRKVFDANPAQVYQADKKGLFPIHIAASLGAKGTVRTILRKCPSSAGLRDAKGRTFLHVAAEYRKRGIVSFACRTPSLVWILNMQDNDGNTALHFAVKARMIRVFCYLYGNRGVHLSLTTNDGQTPLDLATSLLRPGMYYSMNTDRLICKLLKGADAKHSGLRWDQIEEKYTNKKTPDDVIKEVEKMKESSQMVGIGSVLIASIAFRATFTVPGSYIADVQTGKQTHAGRYTFDAFVMATTIAFLCSSIATICLMFSGTSMVDLGLRRFNFNASLLLMSSAVTSLSAAFAIGAYMELASISHPTAIAICVFSPLVVLYRNSEVLAKVCILAPALYTRMGLFRTLAWLDGKFSQILLELWPFVIIFGWPAAARHLRN